MTKSDLMAHPAGPSLRRSAAKCGGVPNRPDRRTTMMAQQRVAGRAMEMNGLDVQAAWTRSARSRRIPASRGSSSVPATPGSTAARTARRSATSTAPGARTPPHHGVRVHQWRAARAARQQRGRQSGRVSAARACRVRYDDVRPARDGAGITSGSCPPSSKATSTCAGCSASMTRCRRVRADPHPHEREGGLLDEELDQLLAYTQQHSPVCNTVCRPVPVSIERASA